jgi:L-fuculose-phosphate aldolase
MSKKKADAVILELKKKVVETCRAAYNSGLTGRREGNISTRIPNREQMIITPSHYGHQKTQVQDLLIVNFDGSVASGVRPPSSENKMHLAIYKARPDVGAVIHTHSVCGCALAVNRMPIPTFIDEMVNMLGGPIDVAEYGIPSTDELAVNATKALGEKSAVLIANHGVVVSAKNLEKALENAEILERVAKIYVTALGIGKPVMLPVESVEVQKVAYEYLRDADV